jgi:hypothetical protein
LVTLSELTPGERDALIVAGELALSVLAPKVSVLVPFRGDGDWRDTIWAHCERLWSVLPYELVIGRCADDRPFSVAEAFNDAASRATGDIFVLYGADQLPDRDRIEWGIQQLETHQWCALYGATAGYDMTGTNAILAGYLPENVVMGPSVPFCTGILAIRREAWIPFDERFYGWGCEDTAHRLALETIYGLSPEPTGTLRCLYHPAAPRDRFDTNAGLVGEYIAAATSTEAMRAYLVASGVL